MPVMFNIIAWTLGGFEMFQAINILRGRHYVVNQFDTISSSSPSSSPSSSSANTNTNTNTTTSTSTVEVNVLAQWIAMGKFCFAFGLYGGAVSNEQLPRCVISIGYTLCLISYFWTLGPAIYQAEVVEQKLMYGTKRRVHISFVVLCLIMTIASLLEVLELVLVQQQQQQQRSLLQVVLEDNNKEL